MDNFYRTLNVSRYSNNVEIRAAYLSALRKYHPDVYQGDKDYAEEISANINVAYDTLSDPEKRARYDLALDAYLLKMNAFPSQSTHQYRPAYVKTDIDYAGLPVFSFFRKSKFSEFLRTTKIAISKKLRFSKENKEKKKLEQQKARTQILEDEKHCKIKEENIQMPSGQSLKENNLNELKEKENDSKKKGRIIILLLCALIIILIGILILNLI